MELILKRHGPKNNDPKEHQTGFEALLDPSRIQEIREDATRLINEGNNIATVYSTPVERAIATAKLYAEMLSIPHEVSSLCGSYDLSKSGEVVNLSPREMSVIWGAAKTNQDFEEASLRAWFEQGLDNPQASKSTGISLREIALRIGGFIQNAKESSILAIGHSGDFEIWLALTFLMTEGKDDGLNGDTELITRFDQIGGALKPLEEIKVSKDDAFYTIVRGRFTIDVPEEVVQQQAELYRKYGVSDEVLKMKTLGAD